jgi:RNA recognition motif-containing protein
LFPAVNDEEKKFHNDNPRLFISNLPTNMTAEKLKLLFPKSVEALIKKKGSPVGFVNFSNAGDAKFGKNFFVSRRREFLPRNF